MTFYIKAGRDNEEPGYKFGDVSRTVVSVASSAKKEIASNILSLLHPDMLLDAVDTHENINQSSSSPQPYLLFSSYKHMLQQISDGGGGGGGGYPQGYPQSTLSQSIWVSFLNASFIVSKQACERNILDPDDIAASEPFLFLGIPALTALECSLRSMNKNGMVLIDGSTCIPWLLVDKFEGGEEGDLFLKLKEMTEFLEIREKAGMMLSEDSITNLRLKVIQASGDAARCEVQEEEVMANKVCSIAVSIATDVSQLVFFQKAFMLVLEALEEEE